VLSLSDVTEFSLWPLVAPAFPGGGGLPFVGANTAQWALHPASGVGSDSRAGIIVPEVTSVIESNRYWLPLCLRPARGTFGGTPPKPPRTVAVGPHAMPRIVQ
jgi:hypothetical protein